MKKQHEGTYEGTQRSLFQMIPILNKIFKTNYASHAI